MAGLNARKIVDPPRFTNTPYGLASYVDWRDDPDPHWKMGITYEPICGTAGTTADPCVVTGLSAVGLTKGPTTSRTTRGALPFTVFEEVDCGPVGHWDDAVDFATQAFLRNESYHVEKAFWTGNVTTELGVANVVLPHLAGNTTIYDTDIDTYGRSNFIVLQPAATTVTGVAVDPVEALGNIEKALGDCYNGIGYIHMPVGVLAHLTMNHLLQEGQNKLKTWNGNYVVAGTGYPGTGPDGSSPGYGLSWIYATGQLFGYRGPINVLPLAGRGPNGQITQSSFDRTLNTTKVIVERTYVISWDCCLSAALTSTGGEIAGSPASSK